MGSVETDLSPREKAAALARVARFRPVATAGIMALSVIAAVLEGIGLGFILPIIEQVQAGGPPSDPDGVLGTFVTVYATLGVPFTLGFLVAGVTAVMAVRFTASFLADWLRAWLRTRYVRHLQVQAFGNAMDASVAYFDREGSDDILNAIVTQAEYAGRVIDKSVRIVMEGFLAAIYLGIAVFLAPLLTLAAAALLGGVMFLFRFVIEPGYVVGDRVADANERIQRAAQAGTQGIRDVKAFGLAAEIERNFVDAVDRFTRSRVTLERNEAAIHSFYELVAATAVFLLIYAALTFADLTLASLGVFLFAIFRLAPQVSRLNNLLYGLEGDLPHLVRTHEFIDDLSASHETSGGDATPPQPVEQLAFDDVTFTYERADDEALDGVSFEVERGEFVGFVGPSGAGKSTIAALIARLYDPDAGTVSADGTPLSAFDVDEWRDRVALVRQRPFLFDRSLRYNLTIGARDATDDEIDRVCEVARVDEFLAGLPDGLDTVIGDDGVTLSGGQRQRVALARALLTDASILVLDEATSDLDTALESEVHDAIEARSGDRLVVAIAHRLSTVADADRIYGVDDGEIVESGTHAELVARDGLYADLHERQHNAVPGTSDGHSGTEHPDGSG